MQCVYNSLIVPRISTMDFSNLIQGTRQFFQGHPGKPRNDIDEIQPSFFKHEATLNAKNAGELFCYHQT